MMPHIAGHGEADVGVDINFVHAVKSTTSIKAIIVKPFFIVLMLSSLVKKLSIKSVRLLLS
jgi:hypothetical protein